MPAAFESLPDVAVLARTLYGWCELTPDQSHAALVRGALSRAARADSGPESWEVLAGLLDGELPAASAWCRRYAGVLTEIAKEAQS